MLDVAILSADDPTDLSHITGRALLDTGATVSGIGPNIVSRLKLRSYGKHQLGSATELRLVPYYFFRLGLSSNSNEGSDNLPQFPYIFDDLNGFGWPDPKDFDVILGMDVLARCQFSMDSQRLWTLSFGI